LRLSGFGPAGDAILPPRTKKTPQLIGRAIALPCVVVSPVLQPAINLNAL